MNGRKIAKAWTALVMLAASGLAPSPAAADLVLFTVTDLGTLGGSETFAAGINATGQVVGQSQQDTTNPSAFRAFRTAPNRPINPATDNLGTLGGLNSQATGINASGQVVGSSQLDPSSPLSADPATRAFRFSGGTMTNLGTLGGTTSVGNAINASGQVVGSSETAAGDTRAFRTAANGLITLGSDLGTLGGLNSQAFGINASGQVVGSSETAAGDTRAFRTAANGLITPGIGLGTLGGTFSQANGINDSGQVVGFAETAGGQFRAFRTTAGGDINAASDLGTLGGLDSQAFAINALGQVVGSSETAAGESRAFLFDAGGLFDLNTRLASSATGLILTDARGINDLGQIVAFGRDSRGFTRSVLLTAVPEPGSVTLAASGVLVLLGYGWRRRRASV